MKVLVILTVFLLIASGQVSVQSYDGYADQPVQQGGSVGSVSGPSDGQAVSSPAPSPTPTIPTIVLPPSIPSLDRTPYCKTRDGHDEATKRVLRSNFASRHHSHRATARPSRDVNRPRAAPKPAPTPVVISKITINLKNPPAEKPAKVSPSVTPEERKKHMWAWIWPFLVLIAGLAIIIGAAIGLTSLFIRNGQEDSQNQANNRIPSRRTGMGLQDPPPYAGPAKGKGAAFHYDARGRLIGYEKWETPIEPTVQQVVQGTQAFVVSQQGQAPQVVVLPPPSQQSQPPPTARPGQATQAVNLPPAPPANHPQNQGQAFDPNAAAAAGANA